VGNVVRVDGLATHYVEEGQGPPVLLLHGASLGLCSNGWEPVIAPLAAHGFRVIALDQPGFGLSDTPPDPTVAYRRGFILRFLDALGIARAHLVGHSQAGAIVVTLALEHPERVASVVVVCTGSLLVPLPGSAAPAPSPTPSVATAPEPTLADTRALLEANLYHHELITPDALEQWHRMSLRNLAAYRARQQAVEPPGDLTAPPLWQRLHTLAAPLLMLYGAQDPGSATPPPARTPER
jgi:pimeloyl-ACP methyl ester carboxylesterase